MNPRPCSRQTWLIRPTSKWLIWTRRDQRSSGRRSRGSHSLGRTPGPGPLAQGAERRRYENRIVLSHLGRVCDIQAADFDGDGDLDLVVAVFGWHVAGEILLLEQRRAADGSVEFIRRTLDARHGTIHVPVVDLNRDGRPDFVALIAQEHETVVAFLNKGGGNFEKRTLFSAPNPAFGCSGLQMIDLDGDGDLDAVLSNGDVYDSPLIKPYQGVSWLENTGAERPFVRHVIGAVYGASRAVRRLRR